MIRTLSQLKDLIEKLGLYTVIMQSEYGDSLGIYVAEGCFADIYVYSNERGAKYMGQDGRDSIVDVKGIDTLIKVMTLVDSYTNFKY